MTTTHRSGPVRAPLIFVALLALLLASCSSGEAAEGDGADTATVDISDNAYAPAAVEIASGGEVTWTNNDAVVHTVTFTGDDVASSDQLEEGESFSTTFATPGTYAYVCAVHPEMEATVTVTG